MTKLAFRNTAANCMQMVAALRRLLSNLRMYGIIERLGEVGTLNSLGDICRGWFQNADYKWQGRYRKLNLSLALLCTGGRNVSRARV